MAVLFNITHDANNLNEYDSTVTDGGDLHTGIPGLAGTTAKMEALMDDTVTIYGVKNQAGPASNQYRCRYYVDPNGVTMAEGNEFCVQLDLNVGGVPGWSNVRNMLYRTGGQYYARVHIYGDGGWIGWDTVQITDDVHYIEYHVERATGVAAANGRVRWWIDGILEHTQSNIDNWDLFPAIDEFWLGATEIDLGTSGEIFLDEYICNDDGSEIGPARIPRPPAAYNTLAVY